MSFTVDVDISANGYLREVIRNTGTELSFLQALVFKDPSKLVDEKTDGSPITIGDPLSQRKIIDVLNIIDLLEEKKRPVIAEEDGLDVLGTASNYWLLDPLDGTYMYLRGFDGWGIILSEVLDGEVVRAFIYCHGFKPQMFEYCRLGGFAINGRSLPELKNAEPEVLLVSEESLDRLEVNHPCLFEKINDLFNTGELIQEDSKSAASSLFSICNGSYSYLSTATAIWEVNALRSIVNIGGTVLDLDGKLHNISQKIRQPVFASPSKTLSERLFG